MDNILKGKTALVTGGAGGIGREISRTLAAAGAHVVILCRDAVKAEETLSLIREDGGSAAYHLVNLSDAADRENGLQKIIDDNGGIDILVNNAGISGFMGPVADTPLEELNSVFEVNLNAPFHLAQKLIPGMRSKGFGRIINISSVAPRVNPAWTTTYNMSKAALNAFTSSLSREIAAEGITVNGVAPGLVLTERILTKRVPGLAAERGISEEEVLNGMKSKSDTRQLTTEKELAETVLFLCSDAARNISGETIEMSGGYQG
jgi:3-hydroxybutyrate dehydrogenase